MSTHPTPAERFQNALRIMHSLDEVRAVLPAEKVRDFHLDPMGVCLRMDRETFARVFELIERRQPVRSFEEVMDIIETRKPKSPGFRHVREALPKEAQR